MFGKNNRISDEDDDFFTPSRSSNLAKIFGITATTPAPPKSIEKYGPSSFRYVPPRSEDDNSNKTEAKTDWSVVVAKVVTAYKLNNNDNIGLGKVGLALLKLNDDFKMIVYRTKIDILCTTNISESSKMYIKNEYFQFTSDNSEFWSFLFDTPEERDSLVELICDKCVIKRDEPSFVVETLNNNVEDVDEVDDSVKTKASIISRMAKMGQPILLPNKTVSTTEISDSSDTDSRVENIPRPNIPHKRHTQSNSKNLVPFNPSATALVAADNNLCMFLTENRIQNTETRMNLSKLESKLDRVLDRIDLINLNPNKPEQDVDKDKEMLRLEEKILELKKENYSFKNKVKQLELKKVDEDLRIKFEQSQILVKDLTERINANKDDCGRLQQELIVKNHQHEILSKDLSESREELKQSRTKIDEINHAKSKDYDNLLEKYNKLVETNARAAKENEDLGVKLKENNILVKKIMNNCYQKLCDQIDDASVLRIIGQTIKEETNNVLKDAK